VRDPVATATGTASDHHDHHDHHDDHDDHDDRPVGRGSGVVAG
jgi:hypothetical protein